jgi:hypothetical protein
VTATPSVELVSASSGWLVSVSMTFHEASAADLGCVVVEDALSGQAGLLDPSARRLGERRVHVAFGVVAASPGDAIADARALLDATLRDVHPIPLWMPASLVAEQAPGLITEGPR